MFDTLGGTEGLAMLWGYQGPASEARPFAEAYLLELPVLADDDRTMGADYFITEDNDDAFARYPRHYVIDREGLLAYVSTDVHPEDLVAAIEAALAE